MSRRPALTNPFRFFAHESDRYIAALAAWAETFEEAVSFNGLTFSRAKLAKDDWLAIQKAFMRPA